MEIALRVVQFWSEIKLEITNRNFVITRLISDQIALHSVQLPLLIKNKFAILSSGPLPIPIIKSKQDEENDVMIASIDKIMHACAILTNLGSSIVYNEKDNEQK